MSVDLESGEWRVWDSFLSLASCVTSLSLLASVPSYIRQELLLISQFVVRVKCMFAKGLAQNWPSSSVLGGKGLCLCGSTGKRQDGKMRPSRTCWLMGSGKLGQGRVSAGGNSGSLGPGSGFVTNYFGCITYPHGWISVPPRNVKILD